MAWWIAVELGQLMRARHPTDAIGDLDVRPRRNGVGIIVAGTLNVDDPWQDLGVGEEQPGATIGAKMPAAMFRGCIHLGCTFRDLDKVDGVHGPGHHRCTGVPPAVRAMAKRMGEGFAIRLLANSATVAAADDRHARFSLPSAIALGACSMTFVSGATTVDRGFWPCGPDEGTPCGAMAKTGARR